MSKNPKDTKSPLRMSLLQNSVSFAEAMQFLALWATKHAFLAVALANLKFCKCLEYLGLFWFYSRTMRQGIV